jgi:cardiolipin synthase
MKSVAATDGLRPENAGALLDQAFTRSAGSPLLAGNAVRLLKDAAENYPAWLDAIAGAKRRVSFENYFICEDTIGRELAAALIERARAGVEVRLVYDWLGALQKASRHFWAELRAANVEVRCFNPLRVLSPLEALHREHRKALVVDGRLGFVSGLCVGDAWVGNGAAGLAPWRDTGIEVRGPAVRSIERAFARVWAATGAPLPEHEREEVDAAGGVSLRIVATEPGTSGVFRLDQLVAAAARRTLWLTDAYFAGLVPYVQALRAAALDGVDVRLLVPGASDIPMLRPLTHAGYRPLLEAGVRVFEWNGSMLHAKTAVADGRWARVGSSNLNVASWIGNYELDAVVEDDAFASEMERMYLEDLEHATEIVLQPRGALATRPAVRRPTAARQARTLLRGGTGSASRATAGALRVGRTVGAALTRVRVLEPNEGRLIAMVGAVLLALALVTALWPWVLAIPLLVLLAWTGISLLTRAYALRRERLALGRPPTRVRALAAARRDDRA